MNLGVYNYTTSQLMGNFLGLCNDHGGEPKVFYAD